jgi:hypothetical protein
LIYTGKDSFEDMAVFVFKFVKENSSWKFDFGEDKSTDEIRAKIARGDFSFINSPEFEPGNDSEPAKKNKIETTPKEKFYGAYLDIGSENYKVKISLNENWNNIYEDDLTSETIKGGLKKGKNKIALQILENYADTKLKIKIRVEMDGGEKVVFDLSEALPKGKEIKQEFEIN